VRVWAIDIGLVDDINESARSVFPDEFLCMLSAEDGVIVDMVLLPGTVYGDSHSFLNQWMAPAGINTIGTAHSHPGYDNRPSDDDLSLFSNMGGIHIITCQPYDRGSWRAYLSNGEEADLEIIY